MATGLDYIKEEEDDQEGEEELFFDAVDDLPSASYSGLGSSASIHQALYLTDHRAWTEKLVSVEERRRKFSRALGLSFASRSGRKVLAELCDEVTGDGLSVAAVSVNADENQIRLGRCMSLCSNCESEQNVVSPHDEIAHFSRMATESGAVLLYSEDASSTSGGSPDFHSEDGASDENYDEGFRKYAEDGSRRTVTFDDHPRSFDSSPSSAHFMSTGENTPTASTSSHGIARRKTHGGWLRRLGAVACVFNRHREDGDSIRSTTSQINTKRGSRVKVHLQRKRFKEFSAVHMGQDVKAHEGAVCAMKFSPDGHYLATGGEDGVVRVWHVSMCEFRGDDLLDEDHACIYVSANQKLSPGLICKNKQNRIESRITHKTVDAACVVVPQKVFHLSEKPLHEFPGHHGDVLDLSWSRNKYLVSSSADKTVCLWQLGCDSRINVFPHNDFVTCVQFNPKEDSYVITGSLDGKVRIWDVFRGRVINWADVREMITAICYHPDGKELVVGTMTGNCFFYNISDEHLQLMGKFSVEGKKKFPSKRITGFQYCPSNSQRLLVTSGDSQVLILENRRPIYKYKGFQNSASRISASFTVDGNHIVSASEDSRVYIWNHKVGDMRKLNHPENISSCENFFASNASIVVPWHGFDVDSGHTSTTPEFAPFQYEALRHTAVQESCHSDQSDTDGSLLSSACSSFTLGQRFFADFLPRRTPTWPEELLSGLVNASASLSKSDYKFLKTACQNLVVSPHAWGQVIVTAGWDGYIRWFCNYGLPLRM